MHPVEQLWEKEHSWVPSHLMLLPMLPWGSCEVLGKLGDVSFVEYTFVLRGQYPHLVMSSLSGRSKEKIKIWTAREESFISPLFGSNLCNMNPLTLTERGKRKSLTQETPRACRRRKSSGWLGKGGRTGRWGWINSILPSKAVRFCRPISSGIL